jgi:quinol monooxygenase YgiN
MNNQKIVRLTALVKVSQEVRRDFERMNEELKVIVSNEGPLKVLVYECFFKDNDSVNCLINEAYADESAFNAHLALISPVAKKYNIQTEVISFILSGTVARETIDDLSDVYGTKFEYYSYRI